jgi:hypothetical protein
MTVPLPLPLSAAQIHDRTTYHPPSTAARVEAHQRVRDQIAAALTAFAAILPATREASLAMTKLEEAMFWANAALARNPDVPLPTDPTPSPSDVRLGPTDV